MFFNTFFSISKHLLQIKYLSKISCLFDSSFIDEKADLIRVSEDLNHEMWPIDSRNNYPNGDELIDFDSAVERMKQAIDDRIIAVDNIISGY